MCRPQGGASIGKWCNALRLLHPTHWKNIRAPINKIPTNTQPSAKPNSCNAYRKKQRSCTTDLQTIRKIAKAVETVFACLIAPIANLSKWRPAKVIANVTNGMPINRCTWSNRIPCEIKTKPSEKRLASNLPIFGWQQIAHTVFAQPVSGFTAMARIARSAVIL